MFSKVLNQVKRLVVYRLFSKTGIILRRRVMSFKHHYKFDQGNRDLKKDPNRQSDSKSLFSVDVFLVLFHPGMSLIYCWHCYYETDCIFLYVLLKTRVSYNSGEIEIVSTIMVYNVIRTGHIGEGLVTDVRWYILWNFEELWHLAYLINLFTTF